VKIRNVSHRGLKRFIERDDASGLAPAVVEKVRNIVSFLQEMQDVQELHDVPSWKVHQLTGDRKGTWSLSVTRNWRMTFSIDRAEGEIVDLDYEDVTAQVGGKRLSWLRFSDRQRANHVKPNAARRD
jgi:toxin HigB-1